MVVPHRLRRPAGVLTREVVVSAALQLTDREGIDGLTIRGLAETLGVPAMSLYSCFASKSELLDLMYFEVASRMFSNVESDDWRDGLLSVGHSIREMLSEHPNWAPLLSRPAPPLVSQSRELLLGKLRTAGMSPEQAFCALSSVVLGSLGLMLVEFALRRPSGEGLEERLESLKSSVADDPRQLVTRQALQRIDHMKLGAIHQHSLEMMLKGFESWTRA